MQTRVYSIRRCETDGVFRIVEFRIPGYPGPRKELDTEVRLMRGKIFHGKIRMYFSVQRYVDRLAFFPEVNTFSLLDVYGVSFHCFRRLSLGSERRFGGFHRRCCRNANIEDTGFNLVGPRPPSS